MISEYELHYKVNREEDHPDHGKPFTLLRLDKHYDNDRFCKSWIQYTNPHGAPEDEEALITLPDGTGVMMEWERPISMFFLYCSSTLSRLPIPLAPRIAIYSARVLLTSCYYSARNCPSPPGRYANIWFASTQYRLRPRDGTYIFEARV
jgi:hypothetical protein